MTYKMKLGKFVKIKYTGKLENGEIFDSTDPKVVEEAHGPVTIILGAGHVIKGLEKELLEMKIGEERNIKIEPKDGFGERDSKNLKFYKTKQFLKEQIRPYPGMRLTLDGRMATIKSVSSGRVLVDFNHLLAGRKLEYTLKLVEEVKDKTKQISGLLKFHFGKDIEFKTKEDTIELVDVPQFYRKRLTDELKTYTDFKNVRFIDSKGEKA